MYTTSKKKLLRKSGIYLVTDRQALKGKDIVSTISSCLEAGVDIIQFRDKFASDREYLNIAGKIKGLLKGKDAIFIINDRLDLALAMETDGIHLGQDDIPVETARRILGRKKIIGLSVHSVNELCEAATKQVDYVSIGPIFPTPTKPEYKPVGLSLVKMAQDKLKIPFVAIGGINESNIKDCLVSGAKRVAVVRAILESKDPFQATRRLMGLMRETKR